MGLALVEENHSLRKSLMNLIFMHQIQLLGQKLGVFWFLLGFFVRWQDLGGDFKHKLDQPPEANV